MSSVHLKITNELEAMLRQLPPEIARKVGERAVLAGARVIAREMKLRAPVGEKVELVLKRMRAWKLDRRISLYRVSKTQSESGDWIPTEVVLATVPAEMRPVPGLEGSKDECDQARREKVFRIPWRPGVTNKHLLRFENVVYDIVRIDEVGCREGLDITAFAKVS
jgi:head-tail adaptor